MEKEKLNKSKDKLQIVDQDESSVDKVPEFTKNKTEEICPIEGEKVKSATDEPMEAKSSVTDLEKVGNIPTETSEAEKRSNSDGFPVRRSSRIAANKSMKKRK